MDRQRERYGPLKILVVDDDKLLLSLLETFLEACGCDVLPASCLREAIILMDGVQKPDAALVDYRLQEDETGLMVIHELRQRCGWTTPAVILTAEVSLEALRGISDSGIRMVSKPINADTLHAVVAEMCEDCALENGMSWH
jgi:CheY-like chemotaxis protein